jgi:hypothetical protein
MGPAVALTSGRIADRQNSPEMLTLLKAFSWHYKRAKLWHLLRILGSLVFASLAPVVTFWLPGASDIVGAAAAFWVVVGRTVLVLFEQRNQRMGTTIHEEFDTELFGLAWNPGVAGKKVSPEEVADAARHVHDVERLRDWYAPAGDVPWPLDVLLCQRSSAVWGRRSHFQYGFTVLGIGLVWSVAGIVMGIAAHLSLGEYLVKIFLPSQPAFVDVVDLWRNHWQQSRAKGRIEEHADELWGRACAAGVAPSSDDCRQVQDETYRLRLHGPQVAEWFYRLRRGSDQKAMEAAVASLIARWNAASAPGLDTDTHTDLD